MDEVRARQGAHGEEEELAEEGRVAGWDEGDGCGCVGAEGVEEEEEDYC